MIKDNERLDDLMCNGYQIIQNPDEYCFTSDATKLANFVKCKKTDKVVDLCAGSGIVGILVHLNNFFLDISIIKSISLQVVNFLTSLQR